MAEPLRGFRYLYGAAGGQPIVETIPVKVSQTLYRGTVVCLSRTSGSLRACAEADTSLYGVMLHAKTTGASEATATAQVIPLVPGYVFGAKGAPSTMTTARQSFRRYHADIEIPTAGYSRLDTGASTNHFRIVGWDQATNNETGAGREWYVTVVETVSQWSSTEPD